MAPVFFVIMNPLSTYSSMVGIHIEDIVLARKNILIGGTRCPVLS